MSCLHFGKPILITNHGTFIHLHKTAGCYASIAAINDGSYNTRIRFNDIIVLYNENAFNIGTVIFLPKGTKVTIGNGKDDIKIYCHHCC